jgi:hypothetical protein
MTTVVAKPGVELVVPPEPVRRLYSPQPASPANAAAAHRAMETARIRLLRRSRSKLLPWLSMFLGVPYERLDAGSLLRADKEWNTSPQKKSLNAQKAVSEKVSL